MMDEETGQAHTAHTNLPVPLIYFGRKAEVAERRQTVRSGPHHADPDGSAGAAGNDWQAPDDSEIILPHAGMRIISQKTSRVGLLAGALFCLIGGTGTARAANQQLGAMQSQIKEQQQTLKLSSKACQAQHPAQG
jgi:hypothetical protein